MHRYLYNINRETFGVAYDCFLGNCHLLGFQPFSWLHTLLCPSLFPWRLNVYFLTSNLVRMYQLVKLVKSLAHCIVCVSSKLYLFSYHITCLCLVMRWFGSRDWGLLEDCPGLLRCMHRIMVHVLLYLYCKNFINLEFGLHYWHVLSNPISEVKNLAKCTYWGETKFKDAYFVVSWFRKLYCT